jgi:CTP-dependent riboflavin kinase
MNDVARNADAIQDAVRASAIEFLKVELKIANTMLDLAASTAEHEAHQRRLGQANEAYSTVARYLSGEGPTVTLDEEQREALTVELRSLARRMSAESRQPELMRDQVTPP